ncbi:hypothetical protein FACS189468_4530 [Spirochaetia bacterium]|nr:hypothetical protein FACS189468_4530 [Spirochaetia bacterium]
MNSSFENQLMKDLCANSLRVILKQLRTAPRDELSRISGLTIAQIDELTTELCLTGEFVQEETADQRSGPGGRGLCYRFNGEYRLVLAICILEKNRVCIVVSNLYGEYLVREEISASPARVEFFEAIVERYQKIYPAISLLAFGMAGFEVRGSDRLLTIDFPDLQWVHFRDHFKEKYGLESILENDIKAAVAGYYETRNFGEGSCVAAIYIPQTHHPGAAICMDGKIYRGRDNAAGEVIFLQTDVKWKPFERNEINFSQLDIDQLIADIALPMIVLLNPDCLVTYGSELPADAGEQLKKRLLESIPREFLPDLVFVSDILPDFLDGLIHLALKALEPSIDLETKEA